MSYLKRFFGHLKTIIKHKRWVFYYAKRLGIPWQGITHDLSKFSPVEFFEGVKYWNGKRSPILVAKEQNGISYAWLHHRGRNKHHYEYWIEKLDSGGVPHKIPFKYVLEMICDWCGACRAYNGETQDVFKKEYDWWLGNAPKVNIHEDTKRVIGTILWTLSHYSDSRTIWDLAPLNSFYSDHKVGDKWGDEVAMRVFVDYELNRIKDKYEDGTGKGA